MKRLQRYLIEGTAYFKDYKLREFRNVENPHDRIGFDQQYAKTPIPVETPIPRPPEASEITEIAECFASVFGEKEQFQNDLKGAFITVWDEYITDSPGYVGRMFVVVFGGSPSFYNVLIDNDTGKLEFVNQEGGENGSENLQ